MMQKSLELKILAMCYWRFSRGCPIVAMEYDYGDADVLAVAHDGFIIETEVKVDIRDLKRDRQKPKHWAMAREFTFAKGEESLEPYMAGATRTHFFFFAVPERLKDKALDVIGEMYPYAGLLEVRPVESSPNPSYNVPVYVHKQAYFFSSKPKLTQEETMKVVKHMSNSLCRIGVELLMKTS